MTQRMAVRVAGLVTLALALGTEASLTSVRCCLTNPAYAGVCEVLTSEDETCASVLAYLNDPMASGKSYCNRTSVRGGWESVTCEPKDEKKADR